MYDVTIIGAGVAGIFAAHALMEAAPGLRVLVADKGKPPRERSCPLERGGSCQCDGCEAYIGFGGLGRSEGKYNFTTDFGGELEALLGERLAMERMDEVDRILCLYGAGEAVPYRTHSSSLAARAEAGGLKLLGSTVRHLGTRLSRQVLDGFYEALSAWADFSFQTEVVSLDRESGGFSLLLSDGRTLSSKKVFLATGRSGAGWLEQMLPTLGLEAEQTRLDLGIRLEMAGGQLDSILQETFETKLRYDGDGFSATTYCMNPSGRIIRKHQEGLVMADGQNFKEQGSKSSNLNFTLFVPRLFPTLQDADACARQVLGKVNRGGDRLAVQRLDDLRSGRSTSLEGIRSNRIRPSIEADPGNLAEELPELYVRAAMEFLAALERLLGERLDGDTLLYALDGKFYAPRLAVDCRFQTEAEGLYAIGDCSGSTHSLSQAAASGIHAARSALGLS
ncbi:MULTISPECIES: NAD(FAD)-utilizing dehydrogenase [unclassified Paenibacillus]|uniref:NAD(P)/FAD-dependent oxidoreductase n=1 Tax=unclassified Paenibacillus TaxID=185978 RepID=UPI000956CECE|nr:MULTISPECIES: NAD(FAD)-utilizing dehydrogenase [unclassified Paenibacillus]ASS65954.1 NAD(FAD)-utilizing dehydrogenase [Paenibacillus sp. RUD330]SIQ17578.1 hypothetical protein SAMN05880555_0917 [Paenibacillus sp. RU4X]SIQ39408.1 hypothetical protein SAMN05880570_0916 [Paenibacillus sp. RU4T]